MQADLTQSTLPPQEFASTVVIWLLLQVRLKHRDIAAAKR
jgi:hypothetical protein